MPIYNKFDYIVIDESRIDSTCEAYFKWKDLNTYIKNNARRGINMPEAISEPMGCYALGLLWNRGDVPGDATNPKTMQKIEIKSSSVFERDLSSFGPRCEFDDLVFLRFSTTYNVVFVYDLEINAEEFVKTPVNANETVKQQQEQHRRPRLSLTKKFVEALDLEPTVIFDIRRCKVYERATEYYNKILETVTTDS
jgi:hypothetical protein